MARRKSGHAGFSFPLKAVNKKKKNLAGSPCSRSIAKGISNDYALSQLSSQLHTIQKRLLEWIIIIQSRLQLPKTGDWRRDDLPSSSSSQTFIESSRLEDLNKNPWLIRVPPLYGRNISRIFASTKRDIYVSLRGRRISLVWKTLMENRRDLFPFWIRDSASWKELIY